MLPADNSGVSRLSSRSVPAPILGGRAMSISIKEDFEDGPIDISDSSSGLFYQVWNGIASDQGVRLIKYAGNDEGYDVLSQLNITEMSFTFDQNGRPTIAYIQYGIAKIWWYDSTVGGMSTTVIGSGIGSPKIFLDDKRQTQTAISDMIVGYIKQKQLCYRLQRDRFLIEYVLATNVSGRLHKIGMGNNLRLQFVISNY